MTIRSDLQNVNRCPLSVLVFRYNYTTENFSSLFDPSVILSLSFLSIEIYQSGLFQTKNMRCLCLFSLFICTCFWKKKLRVRCRYVPIICLKNQFTLQVEFFSAATNDEWIDFISVNNICLTGTPPINTKKAFHSGFESQTHENVQNRPVCCPNKCPLKL